MPDGALGGGEPEEPGAEAQLGNFVVVEVSVAVAVDVKTVEVLVVSGEVVVVVTVVVAVASVKRVVRPAIEKPKVVS